MSLHINALNFLLGSLICVSFLFLDGLSLLLLPRLGISFGGIRFPLTVLFFIRGVIFIFWFIFSSDNFLTRILFHLRVNNRVGPFNQVPMWILLGVNLLLLLFVIDIFFIEPSRMTTSYTTIEVKGLIQPIRIVQLSDIHIEKTSRRELELPALVNRLQPDLIVMTGDYLNESYRSDSTSQQDLRNLIIQLHASLGIYAVNGNVESRLNMNSIFQGLDIHLIDNDIVRIPQEGNDIVLVGLEYSHWYDDDDTLTNLMTQVTPDDFSILLYHKPDLAFTARDLGIDLYLTGHTHGGQFRVPLYGAIITDTRFGKEFEIGEYHLGNMIMYVNRGIGMAGGIAPRIRFLCPPEVAVFDLVPARQ